MDYLPEMKMSELQTQPQPGNLTNNTEWKEQDTKNTHVTVPARQSLKLAKHSCAVRGGIEMGTKEKHGNDDRERQARRCFLWGERWNVPILEMVIIL